MYKYIFLLTVMSCSLAQVVLCLVFEYQANMHWAVEDRTVMGVFCYTYFYVFFTAWQFVCSRRFFQFRIVLLHWVGLVSDKASI